MQIIKAGRKSEEEIINRAVEVLNQSQLIIYPTETCYGLGADALNPKAVKNVFEFKGFRQNKPISIAVSGVEMAKKYAEINQTAENIYKNLLPGPVTVVSKSKGKVGKALEAETKTIGVRVPNYQLTLNLIKKFKQPITATSANISGGKTPYTISDTLSQLTEEKRKLIGLIIDAGKLSRRPPSSVVDTTLNEINVLRQGEINFSRLKTKNITSYSTEETIELGKKLTKKNYNQLKDKCLIFALQGELGTGKTQFAKGIARGLKIKETITSPTFTLVKEYPHQKGIFYHIDAWRISQEKFHQFDFENYISPGNVIAVEWMQKGKSLIDQWKQNRQIKLILVNIDYQSPKKRLISFAVQ
jgi:L-threonylcarbamoyladenylate synthase